MAASDLGDAIDGDGPLSPSESLALIEREQHEVNRRLGVNVALFYGPWGVAYLLGFGAIYLSYPSPVGWHLPTAVAGVLVSVLFSAAIAISIASGMRAGRGVRGPSRAAASMYGWSWVLGFSAVGAINFGMSRLNLPADAATLLQSGNSLLLVGVLYLAGGALFQDRFQYALGVWMLATGAASVLVGVPGNFAVLSLADGGGLLLAAGYFITRRSGYRDRS